MFPRIADVLGTTVEGLLRECGGTYRPSKLLRAFEVSRDIRLPLHIILGCAEIIRNNYGDPEMLQKYLEGIRISGEYMLPQFDRILQERGSAGGPETAAWEAPLSLENIDRYLQERAGSDSIPAGRFQFAGKRILVAEDMEINREIAGEILKQTGATVEFAENGQICLDKLKAAPAGYYDLIMFEEKPIFTNRLFETMDRLLSQ